MSNKLEKASKVTHCLKKKIKKIKEFAILIGQLASRMLSRALWFAISVGRWYILVPTYKHKCSELFILVFWDLAMQQIWMFEKKKQRIILLFIINPFFVAAVNCARMPVEGSRFDLPYYFTKANFIGHFSYKLESYIILYKFTNLLSL